MLDPVFPGVGQRSVARQSPGGGMWATVGRYGRLGHAGFADKSSPQRYVTEQLDVVDAVLTRPVCCDPDTCMCPRRISDTCRTRQIQKAKKSAGANLLTLDLLGSPTWTRTRDLRINSPSLYRLSYQGTASNYSVIFMMFGSRVTVSSKNYGTGPPSGSGRTSSRRCSRELEVVYSRWMALPGNTRVAAAYAASTHSWKPQTMSFLFPG